MSTPFDNALNRQSSLEFAALQYLVIAKPYSSPRWGKFEDPATGGVRAASWVGTTSIGNMAKSDGFGLNHAISTTKVKTHGMAGPSRIIPFERELVFPVMAQQTMKLSLEWFFGLDLSGVTPSAQRGIEFDIPDIPVGKPYRVAFVLRDSYDGLDHFIAYKGNKVQVDKVKAIKGADNDIIGYGMDLIPLTDDGATSPLTYEEFGPGFKLLQERTDTGFYTLSALTVNPGGAVALSVGTPTQQLAITDNNSIDRTNVCTYSTSDPTKATVTPGGLVERVSAGSATITAAFRGVSVTKAVTVS
ncbi:hypothetical protein BH11ACT6_BH11ACT6_34930 [soil metagenome]